MASPSTPTSAQPSTGVGCLLRLVWMIVGNVALATSGLVAARAGRLTPVPADAVFWCAVALMIGARYLDITHYRGATSDGHPATLSDWRRYAIKLPLIAGAAWAIARVVGWRLGA